MSAVSRLVTPTSSNIDLRDIRIVKKVGGTIEDTELADSVVVNQKVVVAGGGPVRMEKDKIGNIHFQLSAPKPDVRVPTLNIMFRLTSMYFAPRRWDNTVVVNDYRQMDKILK